MGKIKKQHRNPKVKANGDGKEPTCNVPDTAIFFSFQYVTSNNKYNFKYIDKNRDKKIDSDLFEALQMWSSETWKTLYEKPKKHGGIETIPYSSFSHRIANNIPPDKKVSQDTKFVVFRFGPSDSYRMIGYKSNRCRQAMHIIGFDFDYSLYDHGS
ncbi:hypothetical protein IM774_07750 [Erysipelotrichaceae bacterium RD49]|nr:hypothetical protein [Erysipelotrichaceae bacterium RD49]